MLTMDNKDIDSAPRIKKPKMKRWVKYTLIGGGAFLATLILGGSIAAFSLYLWASSDLPDYTRLNDYLNDDKTARATTVLASDGTPIGLFFNEKRFVIPLSEMSPFLTKALLAVEDSDFYSERSIKGIDVTAIVRAFIINLKSGKHSQGGSTITQQVVKRLLLTPKRTYERKLKEAILAYRLEDNLSKDEILAIYMNQSFFGSNSYGVEAAARTYFGKHAKDLTLAESALIAGLPQAPTSYNPYNRPQAARARQLHVLDRMKELDWISQAEYQIAVDERLEYKPMKEDLGLAGKWYIEEVRNELNTILSEANVKARGMTLPYYGEQAYNELGLKIHTAMNPKAQEAANQALRAGLEASDKRQGWRGATTRIPLENINEAIEKASVNPADLDNGKWVEGIVTHVTERMAEVRMGQLKGVITRERMSWARTPDITISAKRVPAVTDARKVLSVGDKIWVSAANTYHSSQVTPNTSIELNLQQEPEVQGAVISIEASTGNVIAISGGYSFNDSQFNRAIQAKRHPGSSFKPIVYSTALDSGYTPMTIVMDAPVVIVNDSTEDVWRPSNFEKNFRGPLPLRSALMLSRNLCTIRVAQNIGINAIINRAQALGIEGDIPHVLGVSLGAFEVSPLNLTEAYTAFANKGQRVKARFITSIEDRNGRVIYENRPEKTQVITPQNAYLMDYMLSQVVQGGTGARAKVLGRPLAGKTGTSNEERDAWFVGFTPHVVTGVYVGLDNPKPMGKGETGASAALPIFIDYSKVALEAYPPDDFPIPEHGIDVKLVDRNTGVPVFDKSDSNSILVPYYSGTAPSSVPENKPSIAPARQAEDLLKNLF